MVIELSVVQFWSKIMHVISKSNESTAQVRFEIEIEKYDFRPKL